MVVACVVACTGACAGVCGPRQLRMTYEELRLSLRVSLSVSLCVSLGVSLHVRCVCAGVGYASTSRVALCVSLHVVYR